MSGPSERGDYLPKIVDGYSRDAMMQYQGGGSDYPAAADQDASGSLIDLITVLRKRAWLIAGITAVWFGLGALYCEITPPLYTSTTTVEIRGYDPILSGIQSEMLYQSDTRKIEYSKTTVAKLKLEGLADDVLSRDGLAEELGEYYDSRKGWLDRSVSAIKEWFSGLFGSKKADTVLNAGDQHFRHKPKVIQKYLGLIDINPVHETNLVEIAATTGLPALSQRVANAHALGFIDHLSGERREVITSQVEVLENHANDLKARVAEAERAVSNYAEENQIVSLSEDKENSVIIRQMEQLASLLADATSKRVKTESLLNELEKKGPDETSALDDEAIRSLRMSLKQSETEYSALGKRVTGEYPQMIELKAKVDVLRDTIISERRKMLTGLKAQYESEQSTETKLREQIESEKGNAQVMSRRLIQYNILQKEAASLRDLYQAVLKQVQEKKISSTTPSSNVFVSDFASFPTSPSAPKTQLIMVLCFMLGLGSAIVVAFLLEFLDNTIKTGAETQRLLDLPLLGSVPSFAPESQRMGAGGLDLRVLPWRKKNEPPAAPSGDAPVPTVPEAAKGTDGAPVPHHMGDFITVSSPHAVFSEALRTIRAGILLSSADHPPKVIMVTSAMKGEGKTTILSNLAVTLAQAYHRTLVIDCDLRQSQLSRVFRRNSSGTVGLTDLLAGQASIDSVITPTAVPSLDILPAGRTAPNPAELLGSRRFRQLIEELSQHYEFILIDAPPVLPVADALMLSRLSDGVLMVVRSGTTERPRAQEARRRLLRVNARILGVVLNDLRFETAPSEYEFAYGPYVDTDQAASA